MSEEAKSDSKIKFNETGKLIHQNLYDSPDIVKWRECKLTDKYNFNKIIHCILFCDSEETCVIYTDKIRKHISKIMISIKYSMKNFENENILLSPSFVLAKAGDDYMITAVIKVAKNDLDIQQNNIIFIDFKGRLYKSWKDYLKNNTLPDCILCYPRNGVYSTVNGLLELDYATTPAGKRGRKSLKCLDIGSKVLGWTATGVAIGALFFPVAFPIVAGAIALSVLTGLYATGRNLQTLVDRCKHQQTIGLRSYEARNCWLGIAGNLLGFASGGFTLAAESIAAMELAGQIVLESVRSGSVVVFVVRITNGLSYNIRKLSTSIKFARHLTEVYNFQNRQFQKEKSLDKFGRMLKDVITAKVFNKKCRISGIPEDNFLQDVFKKFEAKEKYGFTILNLETANTSAQDAVQISYDVNRNRSSPFDNMLGLACNGMQMEEKYCDLAAELNDNRDSISMSEYGDTAVITVKDGADITMVQCLLEDNRISGAAT